MVKLSAGERAVLERTFVLTAGYVLQFSDRTFAEFFADLGIDIDLPKYAVDGTSKAKRWRCHLRLDDAQAVAASLDALFVERLALSESVGAVPPTDETRIRQLIGTLRKTSATQYKQPLMPNQTKSSERKRKVLLALGSFEQTPNDPQKGRHSLRGAALENLSGLTADELNDAIDLLESEGLVKLNNFLGTHPYSFGDAELTARGRERVEDELAVPTEQPTKRRQIVTTDPRKVFVVHGRDEDVRDALFDFLRSLGLSPIEFSEALHGTNSATPYIGEALDAAFSQATAVIVLLTGDDEARLRSGLNGGNESSLQRQARPNVLFEAGMAMASHRDRTVLIEVGDLRPFSDVAGRHVVRLTDGKAGERMSIVNRLKKAGCAIEIEGKSDYLDKDYFAVLRNPK